MTTRDSPEGQALNEFKIANFLALKLCATIQPKVDGKDYTKDITLVTQRETRVEVKWDYKAAETGRIYLETYNTYRKEVSGIRATRSELWAHYIPGLKLLLTFSPKLMLEHLEVHYQDAGYMRVRGGDRNSQGIIIDIDLVRKIPFVESQDDLTL